MSVIEAPSAPVRNDHARFRKLLKERAHPRFRPPLRTPATRARWGRRGGSQAN
jgi:hypothetical protein